MSGHFFSLAASACSPGPTFFEHLNCQDLGYPASSWHTMIQMRSVVAPRAQLYHHFVNAPIATLQIFRTRTQPDCWSIYGRRHAPAPKDARAFARTPCRGSKVGRLQVGHVHASSGLYRRIKQVVNACLDSGCVCFLQISVLSVFYIHWLTKNWSIIYQSIICQKCEERCEIVGKFLWQLKFWLPKQQRLN